MKPLYEMTGVEKAANLMVTLGPDVASQIIKHLDEDKINKIATEIAKIKNLSIEEKEELIGDFLLEIKKNRNVVFGGTNVAQEILNTALGEKKANDILKKLTRHDLEKGFDFLKDIESSILTNLLQNEHPQVITVTLSYLPPEKAAAILKLLPIHLAKDIVLRMAKLDKTSPDAVIEIVRVLRNKYEKLQQSNEQMETGGVNTLVEILNKMNLEHENRLMEHFDETIPEIAEQIRERIFTFDNILNLTNREASILIDETNNDFLLAKALKGAGDEIRFKILRNMSQNRASDILNEMNNMGAVRLKEINEARNYIIVIMRRLNDNGVIAVRKDKDEFVE